MADEKEKMVCPNCGSEDVRCFHQVKNGFITIWDEYVLLCPKCRHHETRQEQAGFFFFLFFWSRDTVCPFCGKPPAKHQKGRLLAEMASFLDETREGAREIDPEAEVCPGCGKGEIVCTYLGDVAQDDKHYNYLWKHSCTRCGYERNFAESHSTDDSDDGDWLKSIDRRGPGKAGGCPGPHK